MREAIEDLDQVLTIALVSKTVMPVRVPTGQVLNHKLGVVATSSYGIQAVLSSSMHQLWAIKWSSTQGDGVNYSPTDAFATFPFPQAVESLSEIGKRLNVQRSELMLARKLGLTDLYNLVNDPDILTGSDPDVDRLRAVHVDLDVAVMVAYGWSDVSLGHGFHFYRQMERWTVNSLARVEILDRLLEENHRRAAAEAAVRPKTFTKRRKSKAIGEGMETLFS
jgi:hypothetical protein